MTGNERELYIKRIAAMARDLEPQPTHVPARIQSLSDIRCVLFDVYGTLFVSASGDVGTTDSSPQAQALLESCRAVFGDLPDLRNLQPDSLTRHIRFAHAEARARGVAYPEIDIREMWRLVLGEIGIHNVTMTQLERLAIEYEMRINPVWPMPGLGETLTSIKERGIRLGIFSNAQFYTPLLFPALTGRSVEEWGFEADLCVWSWEYLEAKPSPELFARALRRLGEDGIQPAQVLYVGNDMRNDIAPASRLGCRTVLFAGDARSLRLREGDPAVAGIEPDCVVKSLISLVDCLG